jgi:hypothetical protein
LFFLGAKLFLGLPIKNFVTSLPLLDKTFFILLPFALQSKEVSFDSTCTNFFIS